MNDSGGQPAAPDPREPGIDAPSETDRQAAVRWMRRAESAEARVRELESDRKELSAVLGRTEEELATLRARVAELARANCLLLAAHPIVARSPDQGLRGAINHHLSQRECGFEDREPSRGQ